MLWQWKQGRFLPALVNPSTHYGGTVWYGVKHLWTVVLLLNHGPMDHGGIMVPAIILVTLVNASAVLIQPSMVV